jgi:hypothetical protein
VALTELERLNLPPSVPPVFYRKPGIISAASGLAEVAFGIGFFITWVNPQYFGVDMVKFAMELMLLEFILVHSAGFMGLRAAAQESRFNRIKVIVGFGLFYSLFVLGFCLALGYWRPMWTFWIVTAQRLAGDLADPKPTDETKAWFGTTLALNVLLYMAAAFVTIILPWPKLGVTSAVRDAAGITGSGLWQAEPHRVVIMAGLYYVFRGWFTATARPRKAWPPPVR